MRDALDAIKVKLNQLATSEISVTSNPSSYDVYLNGTFQGQTPFTVKNLSEGTCFVTVRANRYREVTKEINLRPNSRKRVFARLKWESSGESSPPAFTDEAEIASALKVADALKVDKVVAVGTTPSSRGGIKVRARMVDRNFRAGHRAVIIQSSSSEEDLIALTARMVGVLAQQSTDDLMSDPAKKIEPLGIGAPVVLGKRRSKMTSSPYFWAGVGALAAGALAGGIAAALSGASSDKGSVVLRLK
jgi:hypothetical protein